MVGSALPWTLVVEFGDQEGRSSRRRYGPYAIVRHPIYTGIILACAATAAQLGTALAVAGVLVLWVGFWIKARLEERFLRGQLEEGAYDAYRQKVPMLVPFGPRG
jgi:protein-S-isoprenylcysteine O-methyltransferase Ste14